MNGLIRGVLFSGLLIAPLGGEAEAAPRKADLPTISSAGDAASDFTFRRIRPGGPGARKALSFQPRAVRPPQRRSQRFGWFWDEVDWRIDAGDPGRFASVMKAHGERLAPRRPGAREARAREVLRSHGPAITIAAARHNVSPALLLAVISVESAGKVKAVSHKGAQGLMQLMPGTAARFAVTDAFDPHQNIGAGAEYLDLLLRMFDDDAILALAAYNAGEGAVERHGGVPPYAETRDYVAKVMSSFLEVRKVCAEAPASVRDACVTAGENI